MRSASLAGLIGNTEAACAAGLGECWEFCFATLQHISAPFQLGITLFHRVEACDSTGFKSFLPLTFYLLLITLTSPRPSTVWSISAGFGHCFGLDVLCLSDTAETGGNRPSMALLLLPTVGGRTLAVTCNRQQGTHVPLTIRLKRNAKTCARA